MRNIVSYAEYNRMKDNITQKIKANNIDESEARVIVEQNLPRAETYQTRLIKLIPTEVIGVYIFISGLIGSNQNDSKYIILQWVIFGLLFIINPFYLRYVTSVVNRKQIIICTIGFAVWVFSLGDSFIVIGNDPLFTRLLGSIILALYTLAVPIFLSEKE